LYTAIFDTPLGLMRAVSDTKYLYGLMFCGDIIKVDLPNCFLLKQLNHELELYFQGVLNVFSIPYQFTSGSRFQQSIWTILFGQTSTYADVAQQISNPKAIRAVGHALSKNPFQLILPCHRVIQTNGDIGEYQAGAEKKKWLIQHEKSIVNISSILKNQLTNLD
jgi:O-6-methylguanine DNA methyltransferase